MGVQRSLTAAPSRVSHASAERQEVDMRRGNGGSISTAVANRTKTHGGQDLKLRFRYYFTFAFGAIKLKVLR